MYSDFRNSRAGIGMEPGAGSLSRKVAMLFEVDFSGDIPHFCERPQGRPGRPGGSLDIRFFIIKNRCLW
jgi:hypothetical protein